MTRPGNSASKALLNSRYIAAPALKCIGKAAPTRNFVKKSRSWIVYFSPGAVTGGRKARSTASVFVLRKAYPAAGSGG